LGSRYLDASYKGDLLLEAKQSKWNGMQGVLACFTLVASYKGDLVLEARQSKRNGARGLGLLYCDVTDRVDLLPKFDNHNQNQNSCRGYAWPTACDSMLLLLGYMTVDLECWWSRSMVGVVNTLRLVGLDLAWTCMGLTLVGDGSQCLVLGGGDNGLRVEAVVSALTRRTCADDDF